jgi:hypothetical protein
MAATIAEKIWNVFSRPTSETARPAMTAGSTATVA